MKMMPAPRSFSVLSRWKRCCVSSGVSEAVGSSKMKTLGVVAHGAHDLDHLPLGGAEVFDERQRIDIEVHRLQRLRRGDVDLAVDGDQLSMPSSRFCATVIEGTRLDSW